MQLCDWWVLLLVNALVALRSTEARILPNSTGILWQNNYQETLSMECDRGQALVHVLSIHDNQFEDRRWRFECRSVAGVHSFENCTWSKYERNQLNHALFHQCPENQVITGVESEVDLPKKDRLWKYRCCMNEGLVTKSCSTTKFINHFDHPFIYSAPHDYYFTGIFSFHKDYYHDRRWRISQCKFSRNKNNGPCSKSSHKSTVPPLDNKGPVPPVGIDHGSGLPMQLDSPEIEERLFM